MNVEQQRLILSAVLAKSNTTEIDLETPMTFVQIRAREILSCLHYYAPKQKEDQQLSDCLKTYSL